MSCFIFGKNEVVLCMTERLIIRIISTRETSLCLKYLSTDHFKALLLFQLFVCCCWWCKLYNPVLFLHDFGFS